jgi:hypothetical protein
MVVARPSSKVVAGTATLAVAGLSHWYGSGAMRRQVLQGVDLTIAPGEVVLLTGPSGCGKTTLLTLVGALRSVQEGSVQVFGQELHGAGRDLRQRLRRSIGMIFQGHNLLRCLTAEQNVQMGSDLLEGSATGPAATRPASGCGPWVWAISWASCPTISPAARSSGWRSPAPWRPSPGCCWRMNPPPLSTAAPAAKWWICCSAWPGSRVVGC